MSLPSRQGGTLVVLGEVAFTVTMRQFLEDLVKEANDQVVAPLELDTAEWAEYFQHPALRSNKTSSPSV